MVLLVSFLELTVGFGCFSLKTAFSVWFQVFLLTGGNNRVPAVTESPQSTSHNNDVQST